MSHGFFSKAQLVPEEISTRIPLCGACGLYKTCKSPKMPVHGDGRLGILVVGEAPGKNEDDKGIQFCGDSGKLLQDACRKAGFDLRKDCWTTNALICHPPKNVISNESMIDYCRPNLLRTMEELKPRVVLLLGKHAIQSLLRPLWKENVSVVRPWLSWRIPLQKYNCWVCPTWHPSYLLRARNAKGNEVLERMFLDDLRGVKALKGRPWTKVPNFLDEVSVLMGSFEETAKRIRAFTKRGKLVAFDYETDRLKPDHKHATIVSCSISDGQETIAYPWSGPTIKATQELLQSDCPKIASNMKFEERWTIREFGHGVRNWHLDTMLAAHTLDNRPKITSIKFQAFVLLGQERYDHHVKGYLESDKANSPNRIKQLDLKSLLLYNGMDSLLEYKVAELQSGWIGVAHA